MGYKYITENNLYNKQSYMYSEYEGLAFLRDYLYSRQEYLNKQKKAGGYRYMNAGSSVNPIKQDLLYIRDKLKCNRYDREILHLMNAYTKTFEVRKRIYDAYDNAWKPEGDAGFEDYELYLLFAECLIYAYECTKNLKYYSCLLKVNDTILSICEEFDENFKETLCGILKKELDIFHQLISKYNICLEEQDDIK